MVIYNERCHLVTSVNNKAGVKTSLIILCLFNSRKWKKWGFWVRAAFCSAFDVAESEHAARKRYAETRNAFKRYRNVWIDEYWTWTLAVLVCAVHEHDDEDIKRISRKLRDMVFALVSDAAAAAAGNTKKTNENVERKTNKNVISREVHAATRAFLEGTPMRAMLDQRLDASGSTIFKLY